MGAIYPKLQFAMQTTIAIVADCDDTLAPDTTGQLLREFGVEPREFYDAADTFVTEGLCDPSLGYMYEMVRRAQASSGPLSGLSRDRIEAVAPNLTFFDGVPGFFTHIKQEIENDSIFRASGVRVEQYVISSGIQTLLKASALSGVTPYIWGSDFIYDDDGTITFPSRVISFTEKTRFLYMIHKGVVGSAYDKHPYAVNTPMKEDERPVPFNHMIYLGDGPSDVPSMSLINSHDGITIGIVQEYRVDKKWALSYGRRALVTARPEFQKDGDAYTTILSAAREIANKIANRGSTNHPQPQH